MAKIGININTASLQEQEIIFGIDLGTTNSLIAYIDQSTRKPTLVSESDQATLLPSVLYIKGNEIIVGDKAKAKQIKEPENTIYSVKRLMGKRLKENPEILDKLNYRIKDNEDDDSLLMVETEGKYYTPVELSAEILKELKNRVKQVLDKDVNKAVITVPAYFNDSQRQATRDAGKLAGIDVLRILNEPTAASLAYGYGIDPEQDLNVAVYDMGGGTFDISILNITSGVYEVLSTSGDTLLGGDNFDDSIVDYWMEHYDDLDENELKTLAEQAKIELTQNESSIIIHQGKELEIDREKFNEIVKQHIDQSLQICEQALSDSGLQKSDLQEVILVGGSTQVPAVKRAVEDFFGRKPNDSLDPDQTVAIGAAIQADILAGNQKDMILIDVTPLSLGIETMGGLMDVLIPRNTKVPYKVAKQYTSYKDGQSKIKISIYQGERDLVKDNYFLGDFILSGIPAMPAGLPKVEVLFQIDTDGILEVSAKELRSGVEQSIEINTKSDLDDEKVEKSLADSIQNAQQDRDSRALTEAIVESEEMISRTISFMQKNESIIKPEEATEINKIITELKHKIELKDKDAILQMQDALNSASTPMAERAMNDGIKKALDGKSIDDRI